MAKSYWPIVSNLPYLLRILIEKIININNYKLVSFILDQIQIISPRKYHYLNNINILHKLSISLNSQNFQ